MNLLTAAVSTAFHKNTRRLTAWAVRTALLVSGLELCAVGAYLAMQANLGLAPWESFSLQLSKHIGLSYGNTHVAVSLLIVLCDLHLHEKIGLGTLADSVLVGKTVDLLMCLDLLPKQTFMPLQILMILVSMTVVAFGQYLYISAGLCCGARDTLLVGIGKKFPSLPVGLIANLIMAAVLAAFLLLGGRIRTGLVIQVLFTGPVMQAVFHLLKFDPRSVTH